MRLRAGNDAIVETVMKDSEIKKRIIIPIETDSPFPKTMGKCTFEFFGSVPPASVTQCKNVVHNFVSKLKV